MSDKPKRTRKKAGFHGLMLALSDTTPEELSGDILIGISALFFNLAAEQYRKER